MGLFGNLFGKKDAAPKPPDKDAVRVYDNFGRECFIPRDEWRKKVLPANIKKNWDQPDALYNIIVFALRDGFRSEVLGAAEQIYKIDPNRVRATCVWGVVLKEEGRLDEAENVLQGFISKQGENGLVLTNLAKVYAARKDNAKAESLLWHALEIDPNQDNAVNWCETIHRERSGVEAGQDALRRIAALPGSWRAQLWLARAALKANQLEQAIACYHESLSKVGKNIPSDLLMQISGDLGNQGRVHELLRITEPHFVAEIHGLEVGNNLIKAHLELGETEAARRILDQLYAMKRPDWGKTLSYWDTEIAKARIAVAPPDLKAPLTAEILTFEGPIWLDALAANLFPAEGPIQDTGPTICFLGSSAEMPDDKQRVERQLADAPGRMSRALPLFLAEQIYFNCQAQVQTFVPWITPHSFVFSGAQYSDKEAVQCARQSQKKGDWVVTLYLRARAEPWTLELRLIRVTDAECKGTLSVPFSMANPEECFLQVVRRLAAMLTEHAQVKSKAPAPIYRIPGGANFAYYLLRLEQLLAVRCATMPGVGKNFLSGEREIVDGNIQTCLASPDSVPARLVLAKTVLAMNKVRPDILPEFRDKLALLRKQHPLGEPAQSMVQGMLNEGLRGVR